MEQLAIAAQAQGAKCASNHAQRQGRHEAYPCTMKANMLGNLPDPATSLSILHTKVRTAGSVAEKVGLIWHPCKSIPICCFRADGRSARSTTDGAGCLSG